MPAEELWPWWYTATEGGTWRQWDGPFVTAVELERIREEWTSPEGPPTHVMLPVTPDRRRRMVYALAFEDIAAAHGRFARWDCANGWTTTLEQARSAWPEGCHAQQRPPTSVRLPGAAT